VSEVGGDADELAVARAQDVIHAVFLRDLRLGLSVRAQAVEAEIGAERIQRVILAFLLNTRPSTSGCLPKSRPFPRPRKRFFRGFTLAFGYGQIERWANGQPQINIWAAWRVLMRA
jgi:hypothetical protein